MPLEVEVDGQPVLIKDDPYSERIRCDHPEVEDGKALAEALLSQAEELDRPRIVVLAPSRLRDGLEDEGFSHEATMPGYYAGDEDCVVMGHALDGERDQLANPVEVARVDALARRPRPVRPIPDVETRLARPEDAPKLAELIGETFADYPTPSDDPEYLRAQLEEGTPFRLVEEDGEILACASADLVREAQTAELTDCATRPNARGRGLMQAILTDLMDDLRELGYPTAFTLARARIPGVNLAFKRLGFSFRGRMPQSCRIGDGFEDMNVWSRAL